MDMLRSANLAKALMVQGSDVTTWVRWHQAAPDARPFPTWHAFGSQFWEWNREFEGPGFLQPPLIWRRKEYPAAPGQEYHGLAEWFLKGLPSEPPLPAPVPELCGVPTEDSRGGLTLDGQSEIEPEPMIMTMIVSKSTMSTLIADIDTLPIGDGTAYRLQATSIVDIKGIEDGENGRMVIFENVGDELIRFLHENNDVDPEFRIIAIDGEAARLYPGMAFWCQYDGTSERWREINTVPFVSQKGDLLTHNDDGPSVLRTSGTDGNVLTEDSGEPTGLAWKPAPGFKDYWYYPPGKVNRWIVAGQTGTKIYTGTFVEGNRIYAMPLPRPRGFNCERMGFRIIDPPSGGPGHFMVLGIYDNLSDANCYPKNLLAQTDEFSIDSADAFDVALREPVDLPGGLYWLVCHLSGEAQTCGIFDGAEVAEFSIYGILGYPSVSSTVPGVGWSVAESYGEELPTDFPSGGAVIEISDGPHIPAIWASMDG